jgi:PhnB protein
MAKKKAKKAVKKAVKKVAKKASKKAVKKTVKKPAKKAGKPSAKKIAVPRTTSINPYLTFPGNCEDAFNFYKSVFGGKFQYVGRFNEMPTEDGKPMPEAEANKIMHISLPISGDSILMGSDSSDAFGHITTVGNNFSISILAESTAKADKLFNGLAASGNAIMPMSKTFWGSYFGMLVDKFGIQWMVSFDEAPGK